MNARIFLCCSLFLVLLGVAAAGQAQVPYRAEQLSEEAFIHSLAAGTESFAPAPLELSGSSGGGSRPPLNCTQWTLACGSLLSVCDSILGVAECPCLGDTNCIKKTEAICLASGCAHDNALGVSICECIL